MEFLARRVYGRFAEEMCWGIQSLIAACNGRGCGRLYWLQGYSERFAFRLPTTIKQSHPVVRISILFGSSGF